jgi:hypothetical protein
MSAHFAILLTRDATAWRVKLSELNRFAVIRVTG